MSLTKSDFIRSHMLMLSQSAQNYDLTNRKERLRSVRDLERLYFSLLRFVKPSLIVEAGAKGGEASIRAREYSPDAQITAFEANPYTFKKFSKAGKLKHANVSYIHSALSDAEGTVSFMLRAKVAGEVQTKTIGHGSLLTPNRDDVELEECIVEATTLDKHFSGFDNKDAFLWVDVEGANAQVLKGGEDFLRDQVGFAFIEVEDRSEWSDQWLGKDVHEFLFGLGFLPCARDFQSRYQYNVVYVHEHYLELDYLKHSLAQYQSSASFAKIHHQNSCPSSDDLRHEAF